MLLYKLDDTDRVELFGMVRQKLLRSGWNIETVEPKI